VLAEEEGLTQVADNDRDSAEALALRPLEAAGGRGLRRRGLTHHASRPMGERDLPAEEGRLTPQR
jgi:hypothetical protein